nr:ribonuclease H-like domain-containing protein [Tanacetum cinerariifolium]
MKIEHYLGHTDYPIWEVIQKGNGHVQVSTDTNEHIKVLPPKTAKEILAREKERKARNTLLMAILEDHLAKFHKMTDDKEMWEAIKSKFVSNDESKKMFQSLLSPLKIHGAGVSIKDVNQKFLRSLHASWSQLSLIMRTKPGVDTISFDDLYNNIKFFEFDVKGSTTSSSSTNNVLALRRPKSSALIVTREGISLESAYQRGIKILGGEMHRTLGIKQKKMGGDLENRRNLKLCNSGSDTEVTSYSKECKESYAKLKKLCDEQREQLGDTSIEIQAYNQALKKVEAQLVAHKKNQLWSSDIEDSLVNDRYAEEIHAVPSLITKIYMPPKFDFGIDESMFTYGLKQSKTSESDAESNNSASCKSNSSVETLEFVHKLVANKPKVVSEPKVWSDAPIIEEYGSDSDDEHKALKRKGIVDSGCSRHMTGNKACLVDYQDYNGGPVAFGGSKGHITGKGKIRTGKLDFEDVCFVKELQHSNLFSVSQICDKKNKVQFTDTECLVLSPDFMLPDENQENLVRGLPSKIFQNDHTCVACQKGKQHKASWIKKEYSNARTPQQNRVAERKNRTLIEAARAILADSFLPNTFWAEAVSTACYVLNRVLVTKPQNKTPYELITGKIPIISYIRPSRCHVTILNTIDHLGKFDGKSDEGFLVGYSLNSTAFRGTNRSERDHVQSSVDSPLLGGHTSNRAEGALNLEELFSICTNLSNRVLALETIKDTQAAETIALKARIKKLERSGRKKDKPEPTLDDSTFDGLDVDYDMDYIDTEGPVNEGRLSKEIKELKLTNDTEEIAQDKGSGEKGGSTEELVSTARPEDSTVRPDVGTAYPIAPPTTTTSIFDDEDITMAQSKGILKEPEPAKKMTRSDLDAAQIAKDTKVARLVYEEELVELEREKEKRQREEKASKATIAEMYDEVQAGIEADALVAQRSVKIRSKPPTKSQMRNLIMTYLKNMGGYKRSQLKENIYVEIQGLYERQKRVIDDFKLMDSDDAVDKEKVFEEPNSTKFEVKKERDKESIRKRPGRRLKMKATKKSKRHGAECIYYIIFRSDGSFRWIETFSEMVTRFDRMDLKELYNLVMQRVHTLTFEDGAEIYMLAKRSAPCYCNEALAIPEQMATDDKDWKLIKEKFKELQYVWIHPFGVQEAQDKETGRLTSKHQRRPLVTRPTGKAVLAAATTDLVAVTVTLSSMLL